MIIATTINKSTQLTNSTTAEPIDPTAIFNFLSVSSGEDILCIVTCVSEVVVATSGVDVS